MLRPRPRNITRALSVGFVLGLLTLATREARADMPPAFTQSRGSGAIGLRFGSNHLNAGIGALGGYTLPMHLYLGGVFDYWFGSSQTAQGPGFSVTAKSSGWNLFGVGGYDFGITPQLVIRPFGGIGVFQGNVESCYNGGPFGGVCSSGSSSDAAGLFGGQLMYLVTDSLHIGGELRILIASNTAVVLAANIGLVF
jgi:hypothetical protein